MFSAAVDLRDISPFKLMNETENVLIFPYRNSSHGHLKLSTRTSKLYNVCGTDVGKKQREIDPIEDDVFVWNNFEDILKGRIEIPLSRMYLKEEIRRLSRKCFENDIIEELKSKNKRDWVDLYDFRDLLIEYPFLKGF
ncbi:hypothetical protein EIN_137880 [Entamoeba invadens IP1]|uniref:Uncharacterized protein n=1 Tax=Entamoeba invadens IP1 TaxID=370355 RepID=L7FMS8_ENTIV|nr:hypothetical protein EIN_137880 [Entamoeba invadens IP1]ELP91791.1 hypothetical protein EIN_137880 [Entamoeba invadens IP1]|eukprot:XP_004258562.1 hypothetical protein EIN_137880 [Entamoeba invadens IP1]